MTVRRFRLVVGLVGMAVCAAVVARPAAQQSSAGPAADTARARIVQGVNRLYDTSVLHRIDVAIAPADADRIVARTEERVRATVTIDGQTIRDAGVRQSGGVYHPYQPMTNKPSLSIKFDQFVNGQRVYGLTKLVLKNELQDVSFLSEHLTYEIFRRAGLAAPLTAHARVTINGIDSGIYVMREPINKQFLARNFGSKETDGHLYEIENTADFVMDPTYPSLEDEGVKGRTRDNLIAFTKAIIATTPERFVNDLSPMVDVDRLVTYVAAELATSHWDGLVSRNNNTYMYARVGDGRFIFLPWGADQALGLGRGGGWGGRGNGVQSILVRRMLAVPSLAERVEAEVTRIRSAPVWDSAVLADRVERLARLLGQIEGASGRTAADLETFAAWLPSVRAIVSRRSGVMQ